MVITVCRVYVLLVPSIRIGRQYGNMGDATIPRYAACRQWRQNLINIRGRGAKDKFFEQSRVRTVYIATGDTQSLSIKSTKIAFYWGDGYMSIPSYLNYKGMHPSVRRR